MLKFNTFEHMKVIHFRGFFAIFFMVLIFVAIFFILKKSPEENTTRDYRSLGRQYLKAYPLPSNWNATPSMSNIYAAYMSYSQKDYSEALVNFKYAIVDNPNDKLPGFYLGICLLITNKPRESIREFNEIIADSENDSLVNAAKWYKSLALLNLERIDQVKRILSELESDESARLLNDLSN